MGKSEGIYITTCILVVAGIIVVILFIWAFILGCNGNWATMMTMLKIIWFIIKVPFLIAWAIIKVVVWILDKITVPGLLAIFLICLIIG